MILLIEACLALLTIPMVFAFPRLGDRWFRAIERRASRFAAKRGLAVLTIFLLALGVRLAVLPIEPIPAPGIHDEFGYLLLGDTFAHGRLTNPTHPMWVHFESETIIQRPTYCSAFYPAQGLFLAFGEVLLRNPFWGVWLSTGLMCAAICWALQGWLPPAWAFLGGILAILRIGTFSYWADSYWGGSVAALGGALVLGALPRLKRYQRPRDAVLMATGFAILGNSRPYETLFYAVPILIALAVFIFGKKAPPLRLSFRRIILPLGLVLIFTMAWMGYYFWRTTGNPLRPPYLVDVATYMAEPQFLWQSMKSSSPTYHHATMQAFYASWHVRQYFYARQHLLRTEIKRVFEFWTFFVGPALTFPFFFLGGALPYGTSVRNFDTKTKFLLALLCFSFLGALLPVPFQPHYAAPVLCATYALILHAMRRVRIWDRRGRLKGMFAVRATGMLCVAAFLLSVSGFVLGVPRRSLLIFEPNGSNDARAAIIQRLTKQPGKHLIIVHYRPDHDVHNEWVYNDADIDGSKIVWAREMSPPEDEQLINYFKDRQIWFLDADRKPATLESYSNAPGIQNAKEPIN